MDLLSIIVLCIAPFVGLIVGLMPSIGSLITMILFYPILLEMSPIIAISFYTMVLIGTQFGGSVAALWFGVLGETSNLPVLREREYIIKNNVQHVSLKYTSLSSAIATVIAAVLMCFFIFNSLEFKWLLRTEIKMFIIFTIFSFCIFWPYNSYINNVFLMGFGIFLGAIGYDDFTDTSFLTFDIPNLYGGLPNISVLLGIYAVPILLRLPYEIQKFKFQPNNSNISQTEAEFKFPLWSAIRGSIIGFFIGLVPMIGTTISSNTAYFIENRLHKNQTTQSSLKKVTAAEAANNAAVISVLIPLLILGLPIQLSEVVLYEIVSSNNWIPSMVDLKFVLFLCSMILLTTLICHLLCCNFIKCLLKSILTSYKYVIAIGITIIIINVFYLGYISDQAIFFLTVFAVMVVIGMFLNKIYDIMPLLMAFLLQSQLFNSIISISYKYIL